MVIHEFHSAVLVVLGPGPVHNQYPGGAVDAIGHHQHPLKPEVGSYSQ